jgi:hypothetical protein
MKKLLPLILLVPALAWAQSPFDGTWKVNLSTVQFAQKPDTFELKNGQYTCPTCIPSISVKADGTDQNVPDARGYDTLAVKQLDDRSIQSTRKLNGKVVSESVETVSADGKTLEVKFKDYPPEGEPVTGSVTATRVGSAPAVAHAASGSWRTTKVEGVSEPAMFMTFKVSQDGVSMSNRTGESYEAKFDGKDHPGKGDRAGGTVSLKRLGQNSIEETYKQDGKVVSINELTVTGTTMKMVFKDPRRGTTESVTAEKQ